MESLRLHSGEILSPDNLMAWRDAPAQDAAECRAELAAFLQEWWSESDDMLLHSSGSTGEPKAFHAKKEHMCASARLSCQYLQLQSGQSVLLRLPLQYIAAKMMIVRCLVGGLTLCLREASSHIWEGLPPEMQVNFAPLVSLQVAQSSEEDLARIGTILLGGGMVPEAVEQKLAHHAGAVYASYGMTETLSHIALRRINGEHASLNYSPLEGIQLTLDEMDCLVISAPHLGISHLVTNDLVIMEPSGSFRIIGRRDNIINSGGIKLQAEEIEEKIHRATGIIVAAIAAPHPQLGQCVALLWEGKQELYPQLEKAIQDELSSYQRPKLVQHVGTIPRTSSGKIARAQAQTLLQEVGGNDSSCLK